MNKTQLRRDPEIVGCSFKNARWTLPNNSTFYQGTRRLFDNKKAHKLNDVITQSCCFVPQFQNAYIINNDGIENPKKDYPCQ